MGMLKAVPGPHSIHLCIDMQRLFGERGPWPTPWMPRVLPTVEQLVAHGPEHTVFTRFIPPQRPDCAAGMWRAYYAKWPHVTRDAIDPSLLRLVPELEAFVPPAHVIDKPVYSAFAASALRCSFFYSLLSRSGLCDRLRFANVISSEPALLVRKGQAAML
jgi:nicotinamidase-related amidase